MPTKQNTIIWPLHSNPLSCVLALTSSSWQLKGERGFSQRELWGCSMPRPAGAHDNTESHDVSEESKLCTMTNAYSEDCEHHKYNLTDLPTELTLGWGTNAFIFISAGLRERPCRMSNLDINCLWIPVEKCGTNIRELSEKVPKLGTNLHSFATFYSIACSRFFYLFITTASDSSSEEYIKIRPVAKQHGATALSPRCRDYNELWTRRIDGQHVFWIHSHNICQSALLFQLLTEGVRTSEGGLCYINPGITPTSDTKGCENEAHHI